MNRSLSESELDEVAVLVRIAMEARCKTPEFAERVQSVMGRLTAGEQFDTEKMAEALDINVQLVRFAMEQISAGIYVPPRGRMQ